MRARDYLKLLSPEQQRVLKKQLKPLAEKKVRFDEGSFNLKLESKIGDVELGAFNIKVSRCDFYIEMNSKRGGCAHPHIDYGNPCLGDFYYLMKEAWLAADYLDLIDLVQKFLNSYNKYNCFCELNEALNCEDEE